MYSFDLNNPFNLRVDEIQNNEFVYFTLPKETEPGLDDSLEQMTAALTSQSNRVFLAASTLDKTFIASLVKNYPLRWIGISLSTKNSVEQFSKEAAFLGPLERCIPQLSVGDNLEEATEAVIQLFQHFDLPFLFLEVAGAPDTGKVKYFSDLFTALRKTGLQKKIYFSFNNSDLEEWNLKTANTFSGLTTIHLDLSNKCTHSCVFCGIWGPDFIEEMKVQSKGNLSQEYISFMNRQMPLIRTEEILDAAPETLQKVQFGGAGDPLTHPHWFDIISKWRSRGLAVEVLTNFEYPSKAEIEKLHMLSKGKRNFSFLINVSAATAETYKKIRPRQSEEIFEKVLSNIRYAHELRQRDGYGLNLTIVNIINSLNYSEAVKMVELASELGVGMWLKPVEVHSALHQQFAIPESELANYRATLKAAAQKAAELKVELSLEELLMDHISESGDLYKSIPCSVGYTYTRYEVDGTVRPCCIAPHSMGNIFTDPVAKVWHSQNYYQWREKLLQGPEKYDFCKMCSHIPMNLHAAGLLKKERL